MTFTHQQAHTSKTLLDVSSPARMIAAILGGALLLTLCAWIRLPLGWTPVPVTLQTFGVIALGLLMGSHAGAAACAFYLAAGLLGAPVFSGWGGGVWVDGTAAPTLGYLLAFPLGAFAAGRLWESRTTDQWDRAWLAGLIGIAIIYTGGFAWLALQKSLLFGPAAGVRLAFVQGVLPFILVDIAKALAAATLVAAGHRLPGLRPLAR